MYTHLTLPIMFSFFETLLQLSSKDPRVIASGAGIIPLRTRDVQEGNAFFAVEGRSTSRFSITHGNVRHQRQRFHFEQI